MQPAILPDHIAATLPAEKPPVLRFAEVMGHRTPDDGLLRHVPKMVARLRARRGAALGELERARKAMSLDTDEHADRFLAARLEVIQVEHALFEAGLSRIGRQGGAGEMRRILRRAIWHIERDMEDQVRHKYDGTMFAHSLRLGDKLRQFHGKLLDEMRKQHMRDRGKTVMEDLESTIMGAAQEAQLVEDRQVEEKTYDLEPAMARRRPTVQPDYAFDPDPEPAFA